MIKQYHIANCPNCGSGLEYGKCPLCGINATKLTAILNYPPATPVSTKLKTYKYDSNCVCGLMLHTQETACPRCGETK